MTDHTEHCDQTARIVSHAGAWSASNSKQKEVSGKPSGPLADRTLTTDERSVAVRSARYASHAYPGPFAMKAKVTLCSATGQELISVAAEDYDLSW